MDNDTYLLGKSCRCNEVMDRRSSVSINAAGIPTAFAVMITVWGSPALAAPLTLAALSAAAGRCRAGELETLDLVTVVLGQDAKLPCFYRGGPGEQVEQVSWARVDGGEGPRELALLHSKYGLHVGATYEGRVERPPPPRSPLDGAVLLRNAVQADEGEYECRVSSFPAGSFQARLRLRVLGKRGAGGGGWVSRGGRARAAPPQARAVLPVALPAGTSSHLSGVASFGSPASPSWPPSPFGATQPRLSLSRPLPSAPGSSQHSSPGRAHLGPSPGMPFQVSPHPLPAQLTQEASRMTQAHRDCPEALSPGPPSAPLLQAQLAGFTTALPKTLVQGHPGHLGPWAPWG